jgi:hypothetical protein
MNATSTNEVDTKFRVENLINKLESQTISQSCCDPNANVADKETYCKRLIRGGRSCLTLDGDSFQGTNSSNLKASTITELYLLCHSMGLELCKSACSGQGCEYSNLAVYTSLACPSPPPPAPPLVIPPTGFQVRHGGRTDDDVSGLLGCILPDQTNATDIDGVQNEYGSDYLISTLDSRTISQSCCDPNANSTDSTIYCKRRLNGGGSCLTLDGNNFQGTNSSNLKASTITELYLLCHSMGLELCKSACSGEGCTYSDVAVYTSLACPSPQPPPPPRPPP